MRVYIREEVPGGVVQAGRAGVGGGGTFIRSAKVVLLPAEQRTTTISKGKLDKRVSYKEAEGRTDHHHHMWMASHERRSV